MERRVWGCHSGGGGGRMVLHDLLLHFCSVQLSVLHSATISRPWLGTELLGTTYLIGYRNGKLR